MEPTRETLSEHAAATLAGYKRPHDFLIVERMPRTPNGKLQRKELAAQLRERLLSPRA
jgi:acyl-CoA synthetase (AMP-forming)/AMP-acid ligase II